MSLQVLVYARRLNREKLERLTTQVDRCAIDDRQRRMEESMHSDEFDRADDLERGLRDLHQFEVRLGVLRTDSSDEARLNYPWRKHFQQPSVGSRCGQRVFVPRSLRSRLSIFWLVLFSLRRRWARYGLPYDEPRRLWNVEVFKQNRYGPVISSGWRPSHLSGGAPHPWYHSLRIKGCGQSERIRGGVLSRTSDCEVSC